MQVQNIIQQTASGELDTKALVAMKHWLHGPDFLKLEENHCCNSHANYTIDLNDPEAKRPTLINVLALKEEPKSATTELIEHYCQWNKLEDCSMDSKIQEFPPIKSESQNM